MSRLLLSLIAAAVISASPTAQSLTAMRMVTEPLVTHMPPAPCGVPAIAARIAQITGIPAGIESIPACAQTEPPQRRDGNELSLLGMTAEEALDRLVALDPRYRWSESDGVIILRPLDAWIDEHHFLHATIAHFAFTDQNVVGASVMVAHALHAEPLVPPAIETPLPTEQGNLHFSIAPRTTSILEAMNAIVRAHGALYWTINYCRPARRPEHATFMLYTFDHTGFGAGPPLVPDQTGKLHIDCPTPVGPR